jgi:hypothetical protein
MRSQVHYPAGMRITVPLPAQLNSSVVALTNSSLDLAAIPGIFPLSTPEVKFGLGDDYDTAVTVLRTLESRWLSGSVP